MPDLWSYDAKDRNAYFSLAKLAERQHPGYVYMRCEYMGTGLWCDVVMRRQDGAIVSRRVFPL